MRGTLGSVPSSFMGNENVGEAKHKGDGRNGNGFDLADLVEVCFEQQEGMEDGMECVER